MLDALVNGGSFGHWMSNGGGWWHQLDSEQDVQLKYLLPKITNLPMIIELVTGNKKVVICHADYPHNEYAFGKPVPEEMVIWNRERVSDAQDGIVSEITGADLFIFGHTPAHHPLVYANQMYIDTGAVFCGNLTLTKVRKDKLFITVFHPPLKLRRGERNRIRMLPVNPGINHIGPLLQHVGALSGVFRFVIYGAHTFLLMCQSLFNPV